MADAALLLLCAFAASLLPPADRQTEGRMFFRAKKDDNAKDKVFRDLKVTYPSLRQQPTDPNTWDLDFQAAYQNCALKITFPASYPNDPPSTHAAT